jgi:hypothetical protein
MRKLYFPLLGSLLVLAGMAVPSRAAIKANYLEVRSADVYTGPCFASSEVNLTGKEAIMAWKVKEGNWKGVDLRGLSVVAVVKAQATLGDPYNDPYPAKSVVLVDQAATPAQRQALEEFAHSAAGHLLDNVVYSRAVPIQLELGRGKEDGGATLVAGNLVRIRTRSLCSGDKICGNEFVYYPPLVKLAQAMPAFTLRDSFQGAGLGVVWNHVDKRSAFVGTFTL